MVIAGFSLMTMLLILLAGIGAGFVGYAVGASSLVSYPALLALGIPPVLANASNTVGVIGTGKIGQIFIRICRGFGMNVVAYDPYPLPDADFPYVSLEELLQQSDIISLHCPLTEQSRHLINADTIAQMKDGVYLLNLSLIHI